MESYGLQRADARGKPFPDDEATLSIVRRAGLFVLLVVCALAGALAAVVVAGPTSASVLTTGGTTGTEPPPTTPPPTTPPPTAPPPPPTQRVIADGVTIAGIAVGGMTADAALAAVRTSFFRPLVLGSGRHVLRPRPGSLGVTAGIRTAVNRALAAAPGARVPLAVKVSHSGVQRYLATLAKRFDRDPLDARYQVRGSRLAVVREASGRALQRTRALREINAAIRSNRRPKIRLRYAKTPPRVTRARLGSAVLIRRGANLLAFHQRGRVVRTFGVATGSSRYPTPLGSFSVVVKHRNPWWYPPNSDWARGAKPIPPGPGNPLGTRWMGLSVSAVGIHGTPDAASIGYSVSHGCIRMRIADAEWLFERITVGTAVFIVAR